MTSAEIEFDEGKRQATPLMRGLDFADAVLVFGGETITGVDDRRDYGELRLLTLGLLRDEVVLIVWTPRSTRRRVISMRKCHAEEREKYFTGVAEAQSGRS